MRQSRAGDNIHSKVPVLLSHSMRACAPHPASPTPAAALCRPTRTHPLHLPLFLDRVLPDITKPERDEDLESPSVRLIEEETVIEVVVPPGDADRVGSHCFQQGKIALPDVVVLLRQVENNSTHRSKFNRM